MKKQANRKAIVVSAVLTLLTLTLVGGGALVVNRVLAQPLQPQLPTSNARLPSSQAVTFDSQNGATGAPALLSADAQTVAAYQAQLEQAYSELNDAYAQIRALQAAQTQLPSPRFFDDDAREGQFQGNGVFILRDGRFDND